MTTAGGVEEVRAALFEAFAAAREAGDSDAMVEVALALPSVQRFGNHAGQVPALLHEAYAAAREPAPRARLAAALARAWVYGGDAARAVAFAAEAEARAAEVGDPAVTADALDAALAAHWGPDDFATRLKLAARLADVVAHLADPSARLSAHLWRLTTAWECLDLVAVHRQLKALDVLAEETGSARHAFFAASRRAMCALVAGELDAADELIAQTGALGAELPEPDVEAITHSLAVDRAMQAGDRAGMAAEAAVFEAYGVAEGIQSVLAEAGVQWLEAGDLDAAASAARRTAAAGLAAVPPDVDFLLTVASVVRVAAAVGLTDLAAEGVGLLRPYAGRAVLNAGAVAFHGVVDDALFRAGRAIGDPGAEQWGHAALSAYRRIGARWWEQRLERPDAAAPPTPAPAASTVVHLHPQPGGLWVVGRGGATVVIEDRKGLHYLRQLVQRPGLDVGAADLAGAPGAPGGSDAGEVLDTAALRAYRTRLAELDDDLAEAESWSDPGRAARLRDERDALLAEVRRAAGLGGRPRRAGDTDERARVAVRKAIASAIARIDKDAPDVGRLLRATVQTGHVCRYQPDPDRPVTWLVEPPS
jgi:hypothetical protein